MSDEHDLDGASEAAWTAFRGRLGDHVASMQEGDELLIGLADLVDVGERSWAPCVTVWLEDGLVGVSVTGNLCLADRYHLGTAQEQLLRDRGWTQLGDVEGRDDFEVGCPQREADRVAVLVVEALREAYGIQHPSFLDAEGLEPRSEPLAQGAGGIEPADDGPFDGPAVAVMPRSRDHLQQLVDDAMREVFPDLKHDADGDIPVRCGRSTLFVRVRDERPSVELYAELVIGPTDEERLLVELGLLNAAHPVWQFVRIDDLVVMRREVVAVPFSPFHLRVLVDRFCDDVDRLAHELAARVGGRLFLDPVPADDDEADERVDDPADLLLTGLLELCYLGRPRAATVAGLFDHDRLEIIRQIVRIRTGVHRCDGHDEDVVLGALRRALRLVSDGEPAPSVPLPPRPRSVQVPLLSDSEVGEDSLDLGWSG